MALLVWDASALVKRYIPEMGTDTVNAIFAHTGLHQNATTPIGYAETFSILLRRLNSGVLNHASFNTAVTAMQAETVLSTSFQLLPIESSIILASLDVMRKHNLNATDAAILSLIDDERASVPHVPIVLIAADQRLVRSASAEGFATINRETISPTDVSVHLASL